MQGFLFFIDFRADQFSDKRSSARFRIFISASSSISSPRVNHIRSSLSGRPRASASSSSLPPKQFGRAAFLLFSALIH
jgi:hypothetical protein